MLSGSVLGMSMTDSRDVSFMEAKAINFASSELHRLKRAITWN